MFLLSSVNSKRARLTVGHHIPEDLPSTAAQMNDVPSLDSMMNLLSPKRFPQKRHHQHEENRCPQQNKKRCLQHVAMCTPEPPDVPELPECLNVRIFQPKTPDNHHKKGWQMDFSSHWQTEWAPSGDTLSSLKLQFPTESHAISFCEKYGWQWDLERPPENHHPSYGSYQPTSRKTSNLPERLEPAASLKSKVSFTGKSITSRVTEEELYTGRSIVSWETPSQTALYIGSAVRPFLNLTSFRNNAADIGVAGAGTTGIVSGNGVGRSFLDMYKNIDPRYRVPLSNSSTGIHDSPGPSEDAIVQDESV
uniref:NADH dehydrogenase [ubiquinone] iron-sulfur protein 4, mitochondrial n=1 Tax=Timema poppense TaxID=170557 RepID=A0A7R9CLF5_TIMPO|nr:unnamed protein product [Timema poppensis]